MHSGLHMLALCQEWEVHGSADLCFSDTSSSSDSGDEEMESEGSQSADDEMAGAERERNLDSKASEHSDSDAPMEDDDLESLSDDSDNSDIFHVAAKSSSTARTAQDRDLEIIDSIKHKLRAYPLLPADITDPELKKSVLDVDSCERLPLLHCGFEGCPWNESDDALTQSHWSMEMRQYIHLRDKHRYSEMARVPDDQWDDAKTLREKTREVQQGSAQQHAHCHMNALAYYTAAVIAREQEHVPLIGPSIDRRMLCLLTKVCNSDTVQSLICFACNQVHVSVAGWSRSFAMENSEDWKPGWNCNPIQHHEAKHTLYHAQAQNPEIFACNFQLSTFHERFASDGHVDGNPFANCSDFSKDNWEWRRKLLLPGANPILLCSPEDVRTTKVCRHGPTDICESCLIPLCQECDKHLRYRPEKVIPMGLANDNFWGYTCGLIYKYKVRWIEACLNRSCQATYVI